MPNMPNAPVGEYEALFGAETPRSLRIYAHSPEFAMAFNEFTAVVLGESNALTNRLKELVRLRIAFHNQCRSCMAIRYRPEEEVPENLVCSLEKPQDAEDLSDDERLALEYADRMATDHLSVDADFYARLRARFSDRQIVELGTLIGLCVGFGRLDATWRMTDELPEYFVEGENLAPWGAKEVIRPSAG